MALMAVHSDICTSPSVLNKPSPCELCPGLGRHRTRLPELRFSPSPFMSLRGFFNITRLSSPKQVKPSGLIPKHEQPFFLTLFPNLIFFQTMKMQHFIEILELDQTVNPKPPGRSN